MTKKLSVMHILGILLTLLLISSCTTRSVIARVPVPLPARPVLAECPQKPTIDAKIVDVEGKGKYAMMTLADALALRDYIYGTLACDASNMIELMGHIEKLENRLKALGGD